MKNDILSWNDVKEKYLEFHKMDKFTENMAIDIDFGYWLVNNCNIPHVRACALIKRFSEWNNKYPKGRIYSINSKDGMEMIKELDELADDAQEINKYLT